MKDTIKRLVKMTVIAISIIVATLLIFYVIYTAQMLEVAL